MEYFDAQVNGYVGVDFNAPESTPEAINRAAVALQTAGVETAFPTVITASESEMQACIKNILTAIKNFEPASRVFKGLHLEGPFISREPGYVGAHPQRHAIDANPQLLERLCDACGDYLAIVTLAPEVDRQGELTGLVAQRGARVSAGHTDASLVDLDRCIEHGLSLFTHLGNGCPRLMDRHDNILYRVLSKIDQLHVSLIADGHHVPEMLFRRLLEWLPSDRLFVVSDCICAGGLGPGTYRLGEREVTVGDDLAARDASGEHFVGAAAGMQEAQSWLQNSLNLPVEKTAELLAKNATRLFASSLT